MIAETIGDLGEAQLALEAIQQYGNGMPSVITLAPNMARMTRDGHKLSEAIQTLLNHGATIAGINCSTGPKATIQILKELRSAIPVGNLAALPVPYRTTQEQEMIFLTDHETGKHAFPRSLDSFYCTAEDIEEFGHACATLNIQYAGLCCGNSSRYFRYLAESLGRKPPASKYSPDMSLHWIFGKHESFRKENLEMRETHWKPTK